MIKYAVAIGIIGLVTSIGTAFAAPVVPEGTLTVDGSTVTATYSGVKKSDRVRMSAQCQVQNTGVVWIEAQTLTVSPTTATYALPEGLACRADLFVVSGGNKVTYLDYEKLTTGAWE